MYISEPVEACCCKFRDGPVQYSKPQFSASTPPSLCQRDAIRQFRAWTLGKLLSSSKENVDVSGRATMFCWNLLDLLAAGYAEGSFQDSNMDNHNHLHLILRSNHHFEAWQQWPTARPQHLDLSGASHHSMPKNQCILPPVTIAHASRCFASFWICASRARSAKPCFITKTPNIGKRMKETHKRLQPVLKLYCPWPSWTSAELQCISVPSRESSCDPPRSSHAWCHPPPNLPLSPL